MRWDLSNLRHVGFQEKLEVIVYNTLAHRVNIGKSIASSFEREEPNQIDNLGELGYVSDALLHLGEEGGNFLKLLEPEEAIPGLVLKQHEVGDHCGKPRQNLQLQIISEKESHSNRNVTKNAIFHKYFQRS